MYVTRSLSEYRRNRKAPDGRNSGVLIIQDEESTYSLGSVFCSCCCIGLSCYDTRIKSLPFPQNVKLTVNYSITVNNVTTAYRDPVVFIPVLDQKLSSNRYYAINRSGKHSSGEASVDAKEEARVSCCFLFSHGPEAKPQQADPYDIYQQLEIHQRKPSSRRYFATSVDPDGVPPEFLKKKYWTVEYSTTSEDYGLKDDAKGIDTKRYDLPTILNTNIPVGHWYVPFIFVKEGDAKDHHLKSSNYYRMTLYQRWEEVYSCENAHKDNREVVVDVQVEPQVVKLEGQEIKEKRGSMDENEFVWFEGGADKKLGLRYAVIERMKYEELRFGWNSDPETAVIETSVRFNGGDSSWKSYKGYVLVESFVLRRMDKSLVVTFEFRHDKLKSKWIS